MSRRIIVVVLLLLLYHRSSPIVVPLLEAMDQLINQAIQTVRSLGFPDWRVQEPEDEIQPTRDAAQAARFLPIQFNPIYARQLAKCAQPGPAIQMFAKELEGSPLERLTEAYRILRNDWVYRPDNVDGSLETFQSAEDSLTVLNLEGDCEDFAAVMMSVCESIGKLASRIVIREGKTPELPGHAYAEVLIADDIKGAESLLERMAKQWESTKVAYREDQTGIWVSLDFQPPKDHFDGGPISYYILPNGNIIYQ